MVNVIIFLCAALTGIVGTYFYMKDKTVIATSIGAKFDLYWKVFGFFFVLGGITSMIVLVFLKEFGIYVALGLGAIAIFFAVRGNKEVDAGARQKQYNLAGIFLFLALGVAFLTFMLGDNKKVEDKPPAVHHTTTAPRENPKPKTKEKEEVESHTAETKPKEQTVNDSGKEVYVGSYNDGTKVYILTDTIKRNAGNFTCTVRAGRDQLHYHFDGQNYSNSEGYYGNINDGKSPVALTIYDYCMNNNALTQTPPSTGTVEPTSSVETARVSSEVVSVRENTLWFERKDGYDNFGAVVDYSSGGNSESFTVDYRVVDPDGEIYQKIFDSPYLYKQHNGEWLFIGRKHGNIDQKYLMLYLTVANKCAQKMGFQRY